MSSLLDLPDKGDFGVWFQGDRPFLYYAGIKGDDQVEPIGDFGEMSNPVRYNDAPRGGWSKAVPSQAIAGKTPWEFACGWYTPEEIAASIANEHKSVFAKNPPVPIFIESMAFAKWEANRLRLAMAKGITLGMSTGFEYGSVANAQNQNLKSEIDAAHLAMNLLDVTLCCDTSTACGGEGDAVVQLNLGDRIRAADRRMQKLIRDMDGKVDRLQGALHDEIAKENGGNG